jgi:hypothetical protein
VPFGARPVRVPTPNGSWCVGPEVEAVAIERHEPRAQLSDLADEGRYQLLLGPLADVRGSEGLDRPVIILAPSDEGADANDRTVDVLRKLVADSFADPPANPFAVAKPRRSGTISRS